MLNKCIMSLRDIHCEREERVLFTALNAEFSRGSIVQIAGPNGAGKTTLMRILTGLTGNFGGEIHWCDKPLRGLNFHGFLSSLLYFGHLPGIKSSLTAFENLLWYFGLNGIKSAEGSTDDRIRERILSALALVGLAGYEDIPCYQMSAGQQRRVGLARLYCSKAPLWILDEPFIALDKNGVAAIESQLQQHAERGGVIVLSTHQPLGIAGVQTLDLADFQEAN